MPTARAVEQGDKLTCRTCGIVVVVDTVCGCAEECDIICCEEQMEPVRAAAKVTPKAAVKRAPARKAAVAKPAAKAKAKAKR